VIRLRVAIACRLRENCALRRGRVSFETSFDSKQPKLEPKLVSALSETKRLFRLFRFYTEKENFDVSIEPKQTEDQPKQFNYLLSSLYANRAGRDWKVFQSFEIVNCILYRIKNPYIVIKSLS
jgi:hypothetical protein